MRAVDITGVRFGRLVAAECLGSRISLNGKYTRTWWLCQCDCGNSFEVCYPALKQGNTQSCGCFAQESRRTVTKTHGRSKTSEWHIWCSMRARCSNPKSSSWAYYGERGIRVCERWLESFENFYADMGPRPSKAHSIDRVNNDGNYEPDNCKWSTQSEQVINQRRRTKCLHGHDLTPDNVAIRRNATHEFRRCLICERLRVKESRARHGRADRRGQTA